MCVYKQPLRWLRWDYAPTFTTTRGSPRLQTTIIGRWRVKLTVNDSFIGAIHGTKTNKSWIQVDWEFCQRIFQEWSMKVLGKFKALLHNHLWSGSKNIVRDRVSWDDYTKPKKIGCLRLNLTSHENAMKALMSKWAILPGNSNLQTILRHHIKQLQPSTHGPWGPSTLWLFSPHSSTKGGTKVWHRITQSWKGMAEMVTYLPPTIP